MAMGGVLKEMRADYLSALLHAQLPEEEVAEPAAQAEAGPGEGVGSGPPESGGAPQHDGVMQSTDPRGPTSGVQQGAGEEVQIVGSESSAGGGQGNTALAVEASELLRFSGAQGWDRGPRAQLGPA
jgi:hypothetical protein